MSRIRKSLETEPDYWLPWGRGRRKCGVTASAYKVSYEMFWNWVVVMITQLLKYTETH